MSRISIASPQEIVPIDRGRMREVARTVLDGEGVREYEISLAFVRRFQRQVFGVALAVVGDPAAAEDVAQQTFERAWKRASTFDPSRGTVRAWLTRIAHNLAIDHLRKARPDSLDETLPSGRSRGDEVAEDHPGALEKVLEWERAAAVAEALGELPAIHREVLTLRFEEDLKLDEIAQIAGTPLSTVKSRLRRALEGLRTRLESRFPGAHR